MFASRRVQLSLTGLATAGLLLAGCSGKDDAQSQTDPSSEPTLSQAPTPQIWPLTGLEAKGSTDKKHPILVIKIDNTANAAPQHGLGSADLVVEEMVEGGATRLAAFFYSKLPKEAGPVRSMRASDIGIVSPVGADIITSGAAGQTIARIKGAGITFFEEGAKGFYRDSARSAPYNLMVNPQETAALSNGQGTPDPYFAFGDPADLPAGKKASGLSAAFPGMQTTRWTFKDGAYLNEGSLAADGDEFVPDNVLVLRVKTGDAGYVDPAGNYVPETKFVGGGQAQLFHNGRVVNGRWFKEKLNSPLELTTKQSELLIPPGKTWVELLPVDGSLTVTR